MAGEFDLDALKEWAQVLQPALVAAGVPDDWISHLMDRAADQADLNRMAREKLDGIAAAKVVTPAPLADAVEEILAAAKLVGEANQQARDAARPIKGKKTAAKPEKPPLVTTAKPHQTETTWADHCARSGGFVAIPRQAIKHLIGKIPDTVWLGYFICCDFVGGKSRDWTFFCSNATMTKLLGYQGEETGRRVLQTLCAGGLIKLVREGKGKRAASYQLTRVDQWDEERMVTAVCGTWERLQRSGSRGFTGLRDRLATASAIEATAAP
jgi:hypothetical protein